MKKISLKEFEDTKEIKVEIPEMAETEKIDVRLENKEFRRNILKNAREITQEEFDKIEIKGGKKEIRGKLWMRKIVKRAKKSKHQLRGASGGFSSTNWEGIFLGRGMKKKLKNV